MKGQTEDGLLQMRWMDWRKTLQNTFFKCLYISVIIVYL